MQETELEAINNARKGWLEKIKGWSYENWQTILVILIVLMVGVSAYNYNRQNNRNNEPSLVASENNNATNNEQNNVVQENSATTEENVIENQDQKKAAAEDNQTTTEENSDNAGNKKSNNNTNKNNNKSTTSSEYTDSGKVYTVTASYREGITHLARHALEQYLQETGGNGELTKEHKLYIEDYMQNRTGDQKISLGHQETFSENLIKEAISSSQKLSPKSIENLKKYTEKN